MLHDIPRAARDLLGLGGARRRGADSLLGRVADLLFYGDFDIFEQVASVPGGDHTNIVGYKPGRVGEGGLLLSAPLGLVDERRGGVRGPASDGRPELSNDRVWGQGAMSGRLSLLCQLAAAASFPRGDLARPVMVAGTFGEENRGSGTRFLLESGQVRPDWVLVGAPTNLEIVRQHRGYLVFEIEVSHVGDQWRRGFPVRAGYRVQVSGVSAPSVPQSASTTSASERDCEPATEIPYASTIVGSL